MVPSSFDAPFEDVLEEAVRGEMLQRAGGQLRFLHQSFQEYFAGGQFLRAVAAHPEAIRSTVLELRWHDTFTILLGFAGDHRDLVSQVITTALEVDATLTARCLRVAEQPSRSWSTASSTSRSAVLGDGAAGPSPRPRRHSALGIRSRACP